VKVIPVTLRIGKGADKVSEISLGEEVMENIFLKETQRD
jgi:hypothetical protein